jgi:hypothetical protein
MGPHLPRPALFLLVRRTKPSGRRLFTHRVAGALLFVYAAPLFIATSRSVRVLRQDRAPRAWR